LILAAAFFATATPVAQTVSHKQTMFEVENELQKLPTYGVFDFVAFGVERGKVTLMGYAYGGLKSHAERAVKRVAGVDEVDNQIELLPASPMDDDIAGPRSTRSTAIPLSPGIHPAARRLPGTSFNSRVGSRACNPSALTRFTSS
jgi:hypothetical protein